MNHTAENGPQTEMNLIFINLGFKWISDEMNLILKRFQHSNEAQIQITLRFK